MARNGTENEISGQKRKLLEAVLLGKGIPEAAEHADVPRRTAYRWFNEDAFQAELKRLEAESLARVTRMLTELGKAAVLVLARNMKDDAPPSVQVRAAIAALDQMTRLRELHDIEARLAALEQALDQGGGHK